MVIGRAAGTVSWSSAVPPVKTRMSEKAGMNPARWSRSRTLPSSASCMTATEVIGLVIEKILHRVSSPTAIPASRSARPAVERRANRPRRATSTSVPAMSPSSTKARA